MNILKLTEKEKVELREWMGEEDYAEHLKYLERISKLGYDNNSTTSSE